MDDEGDGSKWEGTHGYNIGDDGPPEDSIPHSEQTSTPNRLWSPTWDVYDLTFPPSLPLLLWLARSHILRIDHGSALITMHLQDIYSMYQPPLINFLRVVHTLVRVHIRVAVVYI